jgi:lysophospholipid acyltransferase (LPLAT)-like uncharacterized protein
MTVRIIALHAEIQRNFWKIPRGPIFWGSVPANTSKLLAKAVPAFAPYLVRGLLSTCKYRNVHGDASEWLDHDKPFVGICWHKNILFALDFFRRRKRIVVMVSRSKDGDLVAKSLERMGYRTVRGSSSAGGREALAELTDLVRQGWGAAMIADGPRGPAKQSKIGPVLAARGSGAPILCWGVHASPSIQLRNWDQTVIPKPYATINLSYGEPIYVPDHASREVCEEIRAQLDGKMAELEAICRRSSATS